MYQVVSYRRCNQVAALGIIFQAMCFQGILDAEKSNDLRAIRLSRFAQVFLIKEILAFSEGQGNPTFLIMHSCVVDIPHRDVRLF